MVWNKIVHATKCNVQQVPRMLHSPSFTVIPHNRAGKFCSNSNHKFADDTSVVGWISYNDKMQYRMNIECLITWCQQQPLTPCKQNGGDGDQLQEARWSTTPVGINSAELELLKFLGLISSPIWPGPTTLTRQPRKHTNTTGFLED